MGNPRWLHLLFATCFGSAAALAEEEAPSIQVVVSVAEQKLALVKDGALIRKYPISTSKFGLGDSNGSYKTPLGRLRVCDKIGDSLPLGAVLKSRHATGEILAPNAAGRDPIVTRILWLDGLEPGNAGAKGRGIYIHGTVEEKNLGQPVSYGCIRMRSKDVVELFDDTTVGTQVQIINEKFPRFQKARPEILFASNAKPKTITPVPSMAKNGAVTPPAEKAKTAAAPAQQLAAAKAAVPEQESISRSASAPTRLATSAVDALDGPTVVFSTPKVVVPPQPRVIFAAVATAAPLPPLEPLLQVSEAFDSLAASAGSRAPLDHLSAHLLEEPAATQVRLAFRAPAVSSRAPDL